MDKKIVFIDSGFTSGGAEHQCVQLMGMLIEKGYNVTCATFEDAHDHYQIPFEVERIHIAPNMPKWRKICAVELFALAVKADVIVAFSQRLSVLTLFPMLFRPKIKVISSERNFTIGKPDLFENVLIKTGVYRRANYIVPNNYSQGRYLTKKMPCLAKKIHVITNYTDVNLYLPTALPENEIMKFGIFCRFEKQKNFHRFIEALAIVKSKCSKPFKVDWYGNHSFSNPLQTEYFEDGKKLIEKFGLQDYITLHDATQNVVSLIPTFDAMCLPSLHEGFSNSISEYICCGRPVLCSDVSDNSIMVHDGENGFLFDPLKVGSIAEAFIKYLNLTAGVKRTMGERSRKIAEGLFDRERFINEYIKLIES